MSRDAAIVLFIEHCGFVPKLLDLAWFGKHHEIMFVHPKWERHTVILDRVRTRWIECGRYWPERGRLAQPPANWQELAAIESPEILAARAAHPADRPPGSRTLDDVIADTHRAFDLLPPGTRLTQERYRMLVREHGLVSVSVARRVAEQHGLTHGQLVRQVARSRAPRSSEGD